MRVLSNRVVVRDVEEEYKGKLIIPETAKEKSMQGEVLTTGPGKRNERTGELEPMTVKAGMKVLYSKYVGLDVNIKDLFPDITEDVVMVMREEEIFAILEE